MISHSELSQIIEQDVIQTLGFSDEYFFSLPFSCQKELLMSFFDCYSGKSKKKNWQKRIALKQYNLEENVKGKVLTLLKKNK